MFLSTQIYSRGICMYMYIYEFRATSGIYLDKQRWKISFKGIYNTKRLKFCKLCFYQPKYPRGISARSIRILPLCKLIIYLLFQKLPSFIRVLGHFRYLLGQTEKKISFKGIYNTKRWKFCKLCFYRPKYPRGISARSCN